MTDTPESWKLTLPCTRKEAEQIDLEMEAFAQFDVPPTIVASEISPAHPDAWEISAFFAGQPDEAQIDAICGLLPRTRRSDARLERIEAADWVTISQQASAPVHAGRFFVHTSAFEGTPPPGSVVFLIEASRAFGTGGHDTTRKCLEALDSLRRSGARFDNIADIGTGTGLLAFAARHLWPRAYVTASDIDPVSIDISQENAAANGVPLGQHPGEVALCVASGTDHEMIQRRARYDLVIANILAGPLIELAPALSDILAEGGTLILAGLLDTQVASVRRAYAQQGLRLAASSGGEWPCLRLVKRQRYGWRRPTRPRLTTSQPPGDFGTW
ncbi:MAG: 50S ribosomal protein L11 methyltransferase [Chakrabartia godavariana]